MVIKELIRIIVISFGAVFGVNLRFFIITNSSLFRGNKPFRILLANLISSFIMGFSLPIIIANKSTNHQNLIFLFMIGFLGSLSTFSSFIYDLYIFSTKKNFKDSFKLIFLSIFLGLIMTYLGFSLSKKL